MRRPTAAGTLLLAALALAGCGKKPRPADPAPEPEPAEVVPPPKPKPELRPAPTPPAPTPLPPFVPYGPAPAGGGLPVAPAPSVPGEVRPPQPFAAQPDPMLPPPPPPPDAKDKDKAGSVKAEWPKDINGRTLTEYVKDTTDLDPAVRERALRTIPNFGPDIVRKEAGWPKAVITRMGSENEYDPGVRAAAYEAVGAVGLDKDSDVREAVRILFLAAEKGASGGGARLHAIQTLASFGAKAEGAVNYLVGPPMLDVAYETRRSVAFALGRIAFHEHAGPNHRAQDALLKLAADRSAPVRMEAYQSLSLLGPPLAPRDPRAPLLKDVKDAKDVPKTDEKVVAGFVASIKKRLAPAPAPKAGDAPSPTGLVERDKQVEIMARLMLMRFDPKELTDDNLAAISKYVNDKETGARLQALSVLGIVGEVGAKKIDDVTRALADEDATVVVAAVSTLIQFGPAGKPAIPAVERLRTRGTTKEEREYWVQLVDRSVKLMRDSDKPPEKKP